MLFDSFRSAARSGSFLKKTEQRTGGKTLQYAALLDRISGRCEMPFILCPGRLILDEWSWSNSFRSRKNRLLILHQ